MEIKHYLEKIESSINEMDKGDYKLALKSFNEIIKSNKNEDEHYLILKIINDIDLQLSNLYVICDDESDCIKLPILNDKQAQILIKKSDNFFNLITNPNAEIFIR